MSAIVRSARKPRPKSHFPPEGGVAASGVETAVCRGTLVDGIHPGGRSSTLSARYISRESVNKEVLCSAAFQISFGNIETLD